MPTLAALRNDIRANYLPDEGEALQRLIETAGLSAEERKKISSTPRRSCATCADSSDPRLMEVFLSAYGCRPRKAWR